MIDPADVPLVVILLAGFSWAIGFWTGKVAARR